MSCSEKLIQGGKKIVEIVLLTLDSDRAASYYRFYKTHYGIWCYRAAKVLSSPHELEIV